ncbi:DUF4252 domain-containing protein [Chryseobacterium sp. VAUSW3]|uniref:DUF4252 domain-containing protein n=1 Tax=Chryseobacterium sp. VAUSW3 TaxID=2010998 RepID=UPI000B4DAC12|nr:DUF4252 domain-containing protein [Chryseobacterium sp. VAUSW3]OWR13310.1 hypothetical protein CDW55_10355 [Chryseobacterium sp. VAUSW3]
MKKLLLIFALTFSYFIQINAQKDKLDQLFDKYQESEGVTSIKIAKPMFNMLNKLNINDSELEQIKPLLSKINGLRILIVEKPTVANNTGSQNKLNLGNFQSLQSDIHNSIKNMKYEELMTVNSKDNKIKFLSSDATNGILDNLLLNISSEGNTVLMMLDGKISMDDVNKLINETQIYATGGSDGNNSSTSSGSAREEVRKVASFSGIQVSSGINVSFTQDSKQKVVVDSDRPELVKTEVVGDILKIYVDNNNNRNLKFKKLSVTVSAPELSKIAVNSGANFNTLNTVKSNYFQIATTSGANLKADLETTGKVELSTTSGSNVRLNVNADELEMSATSGSSATLYGKIKETTFDVSSAATVNAQDLETQKSQINASSAANIKVNATENINVTGTSGASVRYRSNNNVKRNASLTGGASMKPL